MKSGSALMLVLVVVALMAAIPVFAAQKSDSVVVPKYDLATEAAFKGTVEDTVDRQCPMSGGIGSHLMLKLADGKTIEVHLAATKFLKNFELVFSKGDKVEVIGTRVQFEGKETIFAREVTRGSETFVFRDKNGTPVW